ncbi:MAG: beta-ketoacyl-ACP synthase [Xanthomonadales bacterium]|nr:beta-ketoacyl-ACP synthase [Xanthomonadales bacterium]
MREAIHLNALGVICALGANAEEVRAGLFSGQAPEPSRSTELLRARSVPAAPVTAALASQDALPTWLHSRNNALLLSALAQIRPAVDAAIARHGAARVAIVLGTSTSGIGETERAVGEHLRDGGVPAWFDMRQQEMGSPALALRAAIGSSGPAYVVSTACSSSAKAIASAARLLRAGLADVVIAGGADSLCGFTVAGFASLESVSASGSNPLAAGRDGIHIGEGAALFVVSRDPGPVRVAGHGESSDAHHISAPLADGSGALAAMQMALAEAGLGADAIDYINLHGTATEQNDAMESLAVHTLFGARVPVSSTKRLTGHTLGAAGALEAALAYLALTDNPEGLLPPHWHSGEIDPRLPPLQVVVPGRKLGRPLRNVLSNSFAFGGSNATLILERC